MISIIEPGTMIVVQQHSTTRVVVPVIAWTGSACQDYWTQEYTLRSLTTPMHEAYMLVR
jgi:hypothetical protein